MTRSFQPDEVCRPLLLLYDAASSRLRSLRAQHADYAGRGLYCIGYPTLRPSKELLDQLRAGGPIDPLPVELSGDEYRQIYDDASDRAVRISAEGLQHHQMASLPWPPMKANNRVYYRMAPLRLLEVLIGKAISSGHMDHVVVPWLAPRLDVMERPGMFGLDAPAHQLFAMFQRLRDRHGVPIVPLSKTGSGRERISLSVAATAMAGARAVLLVSRSGRDYREAARELERPIATTGRPAIGIIVGGASCWNTLKPLAAAASQSYGLTIVAHEIFRNPSARHSLRASTTSFIGIDGVRGPLQTAARVARSLGALRRIKSSVRAAAKRTSDPTEQESRLLLTADAEALPELDLYAANLRTLIKSRKLSAVIQANCVDAFLSAATHACRQESIPHFCVQNATFESVRLPRLADCDVYFAESRYFAAFLKGAGALGDVQAVGLPYYDDLVSGTVSDGGANGSPHRAPGRAKVIGVTTQTDLIDFTPLLRSLQRLVMRRPDFAVAIKLHPREDSGAYSEIGRELLVAGRGTLVQHVPLTDYFRDCDALVSAVSTTLHYATIAGVPTFSWLDPKWSMYASQAPYMNEALVFAHSDPDAVAAEVERFLDDDHARRDWEPRRRQFLDTYVTGADGHACARILDQMGSRM